MKTQLEIEKLGPLKLPANQASLFEQQIAETDTELTALGVAPREPLMLRKPTPRPEYEHVKCNGLIFVFKYDDKKQDILHIYSRHLTTPDDALDLYFNYESVWDEERKRYANFSDTHGLYWFWCNKEKKVIMVISCFKRQNGRPGNGHNGSSSQKSS